MQEGRAFRERKRRSLWFRKLEKGMVDMVVHRKDLKDTLYNLIKMATYWRRHVAL